MMSLILSMVYIIVVVTLLFIGLFKIYSTDIKKGSKDCPFKILFRKSGITFSFTSSMSIDLLIFPKIVHLCSSKLRSNSKAIQKVTLF